MFLDDMSFIKAGKQDDRLIEKDLVFFNWIHSCKLTGNKDKCGSICFVLKKLENVNYVDTASITKLIVNI